MIDQAEAGAEDLIVLERVRIEIRGGLGKSARRESAAKVIGRSGAHIRQIVTPAQQDVKVIEEGDGILRIDAEIPLLMRGKGCEVSRV